MSRRQHKQTGYILTLVAQNPRAAAISVLAYDATKIDSSLPFFIMPPHNFNDLRAAIRAFAHARDWEQFHTPKNLIMALSVETAELMEHFQWLTPAQSISLDAKTKEAVAQEIGDVLIYLTRLADVLGIDPLQAASAKMDINAVKYPVDKSKGNNIKYDKLQ